MTESAVSASAVGDRFNCQVKWKRALLRSNYAEDGLAARNSRWSLGGDSLLVTMLTAEFRDFANPLPIQMEDATAQNDLFEEDPSGAYHGLAFVMLFNFVLVFFGAIVFWTHIL